MGEKHWEIDWHNRLLSPAAGACLQQARGPPPFSQVNKKWANVNFAIMSIFDAFFVSKLINYSSILEREKMSGKNLHFDI